MSEAAKMLRGLAAVYRAGAKQQRGYVYNVERQQQADALDAMADEADVQADQMEMEDL